MHSENCILYDLITDKEKTDELAVSSKEIIISSNKKMINETTNKIIDIINAINVSEDKIDLFNIWFMGCCDKCARDCFNFAIKTIREELKKKNINLEITRAPLQYFDMMYGTRCIAASISIEWNYDVNSSELLRRNIFVF